MSATRPRRKSCYLLAAAWVLSLALSAVATYYVVVHLAPRASPWEEALVAQAIDGDTIRLQDGRTVRYIGIDTPETVHPEKGLQCFGPEATNRNRQLVEGKYVELLRGVEDRDQYGRLLRYVFVDGVFVNAELITEGYARQYGYAPERRFQQVFVQLEQYSIGKNNGMWSSCPQE